MIQSYEPHRLVIQHMAVLEDAPNIVEEVERHVFSGIDEKVKQWVKSRGEWEGEYGYLENKLSFKPVGWPQGDKGYPACYSIGCELKSGEEYKLYLSPLFGIVPIRFGVWFKVDAAWITGLSGRAARLEWGRYLAEEFLRTRLIEFGFEVQKEGLHLPIRVDAQILAEDYPDSLEDALAPVDEALKKLEGAHPLVQALLNAAQQYQFGKVKLSEK